ncbi:unnamed protein product [Pleuronectes platessa]|uniref:Ankyrin repeat domain 33Aa n=1 Tax=Pleuronectes platessa TaxID=8262 RepID=A0A9N7UPF1_PLEPL|nr:unnamed protein product [Pleuronectes platessa]
MATACDDPHLGEGPSDDCDVLLDDSDSDSLFSDDSVLPDYEIEEDPREPAKTLYEVCARNNPASLCSMLERGVTKEEANETDINGRNGLMCAVAKGFVDIVTMLHTCPFIDINQQDNDGNTALMISAQAGFITILNYILNFYSGVDTEVRDPRGFTALIKAGLQGREECVSALLMHGADMNAIDMVQGRGLKDWVIRTGGFETLNRIRRLQAHPVAEHFCESFIPEWPELKPLVDKATAPKNDHPPEIGKRRFAVPELLERHSIKELEEGTVSHSNGSITSASPPPVSAASVSLTCCQDSNRRESLASGGMKSFVPRSMAHRNSVFPSGCIPRIEVTRSGEPTPKKEKKKKREKGYLEPPVWKYKEAKEEKKRAKKQEKQKDQEKKTKGSKRSSSQK